MSTCPHVGEGLCGDSWEIGHVLTLVVIFIFVIMRLVLLAIYGLEYLDNFIQALGISWNFLNEVIHANQSILFIYNHNSYKH